MKLRTYSELRRLSTLEERFNYLSVPGQVGEQTFGFERYLNQQFYRSTEWRSIRAEVITRDFGCDLGISGFEINAKLLIHHMNPMTEEDILRGNPDIVDPEFLITTTLTTHNAIHFGSAALLPKPYVERAPGDTSLWTRSDHARRHV